MYDLEDEEEEEEELEPRVKYSTILQREDYETDEEEDPVPYSELGYGYPIILINLT
jgi:hypothetical protein